MSASNPLNLNALDSQAVNNFREYLRIPSVQPDPNYDDCVTFLQKQAKGLGLPCQVFTYYQGKPIVLITWIGQEPKLSSILLNSHMDVVAVQEDKWKYKPFDAHMDEEGNIYARGTQDMKCVGIQYLEAIRRLKQNGIRLKRTIHVSFVPDEEIGGTTGMKEFVKRKDYKNLNVGFALDEGAAYPIDEFIILYGEKIMWRIEIHCIGQTGHASFLFDNTAGEKIRYIVNKFYDFRAEEMAKIEGDRPLGLANVTSINLTKINGGIQDNVLPPEITLLFDCRITPTMDLVKWEETINRWCKEAGDNIWVTYPQKDDYTPLTKLDETNPFWMAFKGAADKLNMKLKPLICPATTDARFIRSVGCPAIGFSPMNNMKFLAHDHNEFLNARAFLRGIEIYMEIITALGNM